MQSAPGQWPGALFFSSVRMGERGARTARVQSPYGLGCCAGELDGNGMGTGVGAAPLEA